MINDGVFNSMLEYPLENYNDETHLYGEILFRRLKLM